MTLASTTRIGLVGGGVAVAARALEAVLTVPVVAERDVQAAYEADPAQADSPRSEAWAKLTARMADRQLDAAWREWLASQRRCAIIMVSDRTAAVPLEGSGAC